MGMETKDQDEERKDLIEHNDSDAAASDSVSEEDKAGRREHQEGWRGWLVVAASFTVICVLDGIGYSFGVFLEPLIKDLGESRGALSIAGSLQVGVYSLSGPVVAGVVARWGERKACMVGSVLSAMGVLGASYAAGIKTLILSKQYRYIETDIIIDLVMV